MSSALRDIKLFKAKSPETWEPYFRQIEKTAVELQPDLDRLLGHEVSDRGEFQKIAHRTNKLLSDVKFLIAAGGDASASWAMPLWSHWEKGLQGAIIGAWLEQAARAQGISWIRLMRRYRRI